MCCLCFIFTAVNTLVEKIVNDLRALNDSVAEFLLKAKTFNRQSYTSEESRTATALHTAQGTYNLARMTHLKVSLQRNNSIALQEMVIFASENFSASHFEFLQQRNRISSIVKVLVDVQSVINETKVQILL